MSKKHKATKATSENTELIESAEPVVGAESPVEATSTSVDPTSVSSDNSAAATDESPAVTKAELAELLTRVTQLESDKAHLEAKLKVVAGDKPKGHFSWRAVSAGILVFVGCISLVAANLSSWADRTLVDNKVYTETVAPIASNSAVQTAIQAYAFKELTARVNFEQVVSDVLPEKAQILATPLAGQLKNYSNQLIGEVVRSQQFAQVWVTVNSTVHQQLITTVTNYQGDGTVDVSQLYAFISKQLESTPLKFLANQTLPANIGEIKLFEVTQLKAAHEALVALHEIRVWSLVITLVSFAGAIALSRRRMHTLMVTGIAVIFTMVISIIVALAARTYGLNQIADPVNRDAALAIWSILMRGLFSQTQGIIALGGVTAIGAWLVAGEGAIARGRATLSHQSSQFIHGVWENSENNKFVLWLARFKHFVEWFVVVLGVLVIAALLPLTYGLVIGVAIGVALFVLAIEFVASAAQAAKPVVLPTAVISTK